MTALITSNFRLTNASAFVTSLQNNSYYLVIGRPYSWADDLNPPTPVDSSNNILSYWEESMSARKVQSSDVAQAAIRYNWITGTVYDFYDSSVSLSSLIFYVVTTDYNVYKCIRNNSGAASTVMPTGTSNSIFQTGDGYQWKYLYTITQADALKFLTYDYIPVRTNSTVSAAAIAGGIHFIKITNGGSGYTTASISISGDGSGFVGTVVLNSGVVIGITISNPGVNFNIANVLITGDGTLATATAMISPPGGHGSNVEFELNSYFVNISNTIAFNINSDFTIQNDYRRLMLVKDPTLYGTNTIGSASTYDCSTTYTIQHVSGSTTIGTDELFTGNTSGSKASVIEKTQTNVSPLRYSIKTVRDISVNIASMSGSEQITSSLGGIWQIQSTVTSELNHNSGSTIFVEQRRPIMRDTNQTENIIIVVEF